MNQNSCFKVCFVLALFSFASCNKLDTNPSDFLTPENYFTSEAQADAYLASVYDVLNTDLPSYREYQRTQFAEGTDESYNTSNINVPYLAHYSFTANDVAAAGWWASLYSGINRANVLLENLNRVPLSETKRKIILGEAKFLRAYYHFTATHLWGNVPLKTASAKSVNDGQVAYTNSKDVYDFVIKEMTEAADLLNAQTAASISYNERVTQTAVWGMLARVCLYAAGKPVNDTRRYADALDFAKKVEASGLHRLTPDYKQMFINHSADAYDNANRECIWDVGFYVNPANPALRELLASVIGIATNSNTTWSRVTAVTRTTAILYRSYESVYDPVAKTDISPDLRRDWCVAPITHVGGSLTVDPVETSVAWNSWWMRFPGKWRRKHEVVIPRDNNNTPQNFPLLRYADVLLMLAEAENEVNGPTTVAYNALNKVRRRAYGALLPAPPPTAVNADAPAGLSKDAFRKYIQDERMRELNGECLRKPDLIRWGILVETVKARAALAINGSTERFPDNTQKIPPVTGTTDRSTAALDGNFISVRNNLLPIPALELANNKLAKQNTGY